MKPQRVPHGARRRLRGEGMLRGWAGGGWQGEPGLGRRQGPGGCGSKPRGRSQWPGRVQPAGSLPRSQGSGVPVEVLLGCDVGGAVPSSRASWPGSQPLAGSLDFPILFPESCVTYVPSRSQYGETGFQASSCNYRPASALLSSDFVFHVWKLLSGA